MILIPCPKCHHPSVDLYKDTSPGARAWPGNAVIHCRICGHRVFGALALEYSNAQARLWEEKEQRAQQEKAERLALLREKEAEKAARLALKRKRDREYQKRRRAALRLASTCVKPPSESDSLTCAYSECSLPKRPNSKYCSRDCSNKNARANFKKKRESNKQAS